MNEEDPCISRVEDKGEGVCVGEQWGEREG